MRRAGIQLRQRGDQMIKRGFDRKGASSLLADEPVLTVRSKLKASLNIFGGQFGKIAQDVLLGHARGKPTEHVIHGDAHMADARLAAALSGFNRDDVVIIHIKQAMPVKMKNQGLSGLHEQPLEFFYGSSAKPTQQIVRRVTAKIA
jgi:hypothetical protein